jgi:hypothetical protein
MTEIVWRSQLKQDRFVALMLDGKRAGTFVDIGAGEPECISNTVVLEREFGWRGILCDIEHADALAERRSPHNEVLRDALALNRSDWSELFSEIAEDGFLDYLSLDIEPPDATLEVMLRLPLDLHRFRIATVEHDCYRDENGNLRRELVRTYMAWRGYLLVCELGATGHGPVEDWYIHQESGLTLSKGLEVLKAMEMVK